ncbi:MAG: Ig-like domain-containing protein [bacterium]
MRRARYRRARAFAAMLALEAALVLACAQRGSPPGGPIDRDAPHVASVFPADGATNVAVVDTVRLRFSERVDHKSVERAIRIFPNAEPLRFSWSESEVAITLAPGAPAGAAGEYVVTLLSSAEDRRGNRLAETFEAAFSLRDSIPSGVIEGTLSGVSGRGVARVLLFSSPGPPADSLAAVTPLRETAPAANGAFRFSHLASGADETYAIFGLLQESSGDAIDRDRDRVAFGPDSICASAAALGARTPPDTSGSAPDSAGAPPLLLKLVGFDDPAKIRGFVDGGGSGRFARLAAIGDSPDTLETAIDSAGVFVLDSVAAGSYRLVVRDTNTTTETPFARAPGVIRVRPGDDLVFGEPPRAPEPADTSAASDSTVAAPRDIFLAPDSSGAARGDSVLAPTIPLNAPEPQR